MSHSNSQNSIATAGESLLQRLGGEAALASVVGAFYFNILRDERVARFFADVDVDAVRRHQQTFLAAALGARDSYSGRDLHDAHEWLIKTEGLNRGHLETMTDILATTLAQYGYSAELRHAVVEQVAALGAELFSTASFSSQSKE